MGVVSLNPFDNRCSNFFTSLWSGNATHSAPLLLSHTSIKLPANIASHFSLPSLVNFSSRSFPARQLSRRVQQCVKSERTHRFVAPSFNSLVSLLVSNPLASVSALVFCLKDDAILHMLLLLRRSLAMQSPL